MPPSPLFDAVLFDLGGVITATPFAQMRAAAIAKGHEPDALFNLFMGPDGHDTDHPWHRVERGEITMKEMRPLIAALAVERGIELDPNRPTMFSAGTKNPLGDLRAEVLELLADLRTAGYKLAMVTNNAIEIRPLWFPLAPWDDIFDVIIDSSEVKMRKPSPGIFNLTLERLGGILPHRAIFVDDLPGNVRGAQTLGLIGVHMTDDYHHGIAEIRALTGV